MQAAKKGKGERGKGKGKREKGKGKGERGRERESSKKKTSAEWLKVPLPQGKKTKYQGNHQEATSLRNRLCLRFSASSNSPMVESVLTPTAAPALAKTIPPGTNFFPQRPPSSLVLPQLFTEAPLALVLLAAEDMELERALSF